jgi:hypothetical protein
MSIDWTEAKQCHDECGVGSALSHDEIRDYLEWLDNNPPPSSQGVGGRRRTRKGEVRRHAKRLAQAKNSRAVGFGWWVFLLTSPTVWSLILQIVQWWFSRRGYQEDEVAL